VGIDPHKQTHTAVAVDAGTGRVLGELTVKARTKGFELLVGWARGLGDDRKFAVEDRTRLRASGAAPDRPWRALSACAASDDGRGQTDRSRRR
jgi:hypothetical protein